MAVKQKVVECVSQQSDVDDLQVIIRYLQEIPEQKGLQDKFCAQIVMALGTLQIPTDPNKYMQFINGIKSVQEMLIKECSNSNLLYASLETFYKEISDPSKQSSPAMSIVLQLINVDYIPSTVKYLLQSNYSEQGLETALFTLCSWLTKWFCTENLGPLVLAFIQGLENDSHYDILLEVTEATIEKLFRLILLPEQRKYIAPVVFHMLVHVQHRPGVFHKIIPHVGNVISLLEKDKSDSSIGYIQKLVDLCTALMELFPTYDNMYEPLRKVLMVYYPSSQYKDILNCKSWFDGSTSITISRYSPGKVGLNNLGNTCYMNSVLQALFMTKIFRNQVLLSQKEEVIIFSKLQLLFALLQHSQKSSLSPNDILNLARPPGFIQGHQHDSSEFLGYLLDVLHEQEKCHMPNVTEVAATSVAGASNAANSTIVQEAFGGKTITVYQCGDCGTKSERIDNFRELQLSFPSNKDNQSVQDLVEYYVQPEKLSDDNQYQCDVCQRLTDGERVTRVIETPQQLILTLKHFRYDPASQQRTKLLTHFNLNEYIILEGVQYILNAVVVHSGCSVDSGHYYTFAKDNNDWYKFNDCFVTKSSSEELRALKPPATPYILFYSKQNCLETSDLDKNLLPPRLQSALAQDNSEFELEKRRRPIIKTYNTRQNRNDDPPPPSCGGGGFSDSSSNMYVC